MGRVVGGRRHLPLRPLEDARPDLRDRHAAADGERLAAHRPRDVLHPHRPRGPVPPHAGRRGLLPDGLGRQRPAHRAARAELLRRAVRPVAAQRPRLRRHRPRTPRRHPRRRQPAELHRAVPTPHGRGREGVRVALPPARAVGRLAADLHDDRRGVAPGFAAGVPAARARGQGVHRRGADDVGRRLPHRRSPRPRSRTARSPAPTTASPSTSRAAAAVSRSRPRGPSSSPPAWRWS